MLCLNIFSYLFLRHSRVYQGLNIALMVILAMHLILFKFDHNMLGIHLYRTVSVTKLETKIHQRCSQSSATERIRNFGFALCLSAKAAQEVFRFSNNRRAHVFVSNVYLNLKTRTFLRNNIKWFYGFSSLTSIGRVMG